MKMKVTGRDLKFFFLGVLAILLIDLALDWDNFVESFKEGYNGARKTEAVE